MKATSSGTQQSSATLNYTLITGACKGIGKALAIECATRGMNLLLVSNDHECLEGVCLEIRSKHPIQCHSFCIDLMDEDSSFRVYDWARKNNYRVNILINNVGLGRGGMFSKMSLQDIRQMMLLNNRVMVEMTYHFLPDLVSQEKAYILSLSSLEATLPLPYKAIYTGTKTFIYSFSLAIAQELKFTNVKVSVLCPGPVLTNQDGLSRIKAHGKKSQVIMMYPGEVAHYAVKKMLSGKQIIVPGFLNGIFFKLGTLLPVGIKMNLLERIFRVYKN